LGELIHNSFVIEHLKELGVKTLHKIPDSPCVGYCIIRSHGENESVFKKLRDLGFNIVDLTCLDVKKVQKKAVELVQDGYFLIILGKAQHPEVKAIKGYAENASKSKDSNNIYVADNIESLKEIEDKIKKAKKVGVVLQTTQTKEFLFEAIDYLSTITKVLRVQNTICPSTALRQNEAKELAKQSDLMIVVGSKKSANTTHLAELLTKITKTIHIEKDDELAEYKAVIQTAKNIGVTAGASTPDEIIQNVIKKLEIM